MELQSRGSRTVVLGWSVIVTIELWVTRMSLGLGFWVVRRKVDSG